MSEYIVQYAAGLQEGPDDRCIKLVSTAKHFSGYDLEHWEGLDRQSFTANISSHDLVSYFWPPFMAAAQRARVHSIMCSYNSVSLDGAPEVPSCAWSWANNDVIRNQWGWDGFIVSDCSAISDFRPARHNYTADLVHAAAAAVLGGTDVNCGTVYQNYLVDAVTSGLLTMEDLVVVGTRFFSVVFATGLYDPPDACDYNSYGPDRVDTPAHRELAKEAAIQGIALLANDDTSTPWGKGPLLPLKASALAGKTVAVIGPNANSTQVRDELCYRCCLVVLTDGIVSCVCFPGTPVDLPRNKHRGEQSECVARTSTPCGCGWF